MSQNSPTKLPKKLLPTMYDLPCEDVGEFSFSDDFYFVQAELLNNTFRPPKWQVYSQILQIPYYVVFDRYEDKLRIFKLNDGNYQPLELSESRLWLDEIGIGIGVWHGYYKIIDRLWLRWYDSDNNWIPTPEEIADAEKQ